MLKFDFRIISLFSILFSFSNDLLAQCVSPLALTVSIATNTTQIIFDITSSRGTNDGYDVYLFLQSGALYTDLYSNAVPAPGISIITHTIPCETYNYQISAKSI